jgi:hypothetical protein
VNAKASKAQIGIIGRRWVAAEREILKPVGNFGRLAVDDFVNVNARFIEEAAMEELDLKRQLLVSPQRVRGEKAYLPIVVVIELLEIIRQFRIRRLV